MAASWASMVFRWSTPNGSQTLTKLSCWTGTVGGWLALVHFHLASLERFGALLSLQAKTATTAESAAKPTKSKKA